MTNPAIDDRLREALADMFASYARQLLYACPWDYTVKAGGVHGGAGAPVTLDLASTDARMPDLTGCPVWPASDGSVAEPAVGTRVMVVFSGANPALYRVVSMDPKTPPTAVHAPTAGVIPVALSTLVATQLSNIQTALNTHVHAGVTTGPGTSGTAAPIYTPGPVAATVLQGQ